MRYLSLWVEDAVLSTNGHKINSLNLSKPLKKEYCGWPHTKNKHVLWWDACDYYSYQSFVWNRGEMLASPTGSPTRSTRKWNGIEGNTHRKKKPCVKPWKITKIASILLGGTYLSKLIIKPWLDAPC